VYGAAAALMKIWKDLVSWRAEELVMKYSELLRDRDGSIENEIFDVLSGFPQQTQVEIADKIRAAFERGEKVWRESYLPILLGSTENAAAFLAKFDDENVAA
jgi:hypothetical protein